MPELSTAAQLIGGGIVTGLFGVLGWAISTSIRAARDVASIRKDVEANSRNLCTVVDEGSKPVQAFMAKFEEWKVGVNRRLDGHSAGIDEQTDSIRALTAAIASTQEEMRVRLTGLETLIKRNGR